MGKEKEESALKQKGLHKGILLAVAVILILAVIALLAVFAPGRATAKKAAEKLSLGERYLSELDYEQAIAAYQAAIEIDPKCEEAYLALADIYMKIGEFALAEEILEQAVEALGSETEGIWEKKEDLEDAIQYAKEHPTPEPEPTAALNSDPTSTEATTVAPTAEVTKTPGPTATEAPAPTSEARLEGVSVGEVVTFGHYEQDNDLTNGAEAIEWIVLDVQDGRALLLSKYGLDAKPYHDEFPYVTWETCMLRSWLNEEFYNLAFDEAEQALIPMVTITNPDNSDWGTYGGNDTRDKVFLLSIEEVYAYFTEDVDYVNKERATKPTTYAIAQGARYADVYDDWRDGNCSWWLRSPGRVLDAAYVRGDGRILETSVNYDCTAVRPALWVNLDDTATDVPTATPKPTAAPTAKPTTAPKPTATPNPGIGSVSVGEIVTFGSYEQDNNLTNGTETIEWLVLDIQDGRALLLSKYGIDAKPYHEEYADVTWETCTLRGWLNEEFYYQAFAEEEQALIPMVTITNPDNSVWGTDGGNDTRDKVFLLSIEEAYAYFPEDADYENKERATKPTAYAIAQGAWNSKNSDWDYGNCYWWLRSPGYYQDFAAGVSGRGGVDGFGYYVDHVMYVVRPALWVNLDATAEVVPTATPKPTATPTPKPGIGSVSVGDIVTFGSYEQDNDLTNGAEAIEWLVLDVQDGRALLLSKYGLDAKPYHEKREDVTWETCTLRGWLNEEFYNLAFNEAEQALVPMVTITNSDNLYCETDGGNDTRDKIFLLSIEEAYAYFPEDTVSVINGYRKNKERATMPTAYAVAQGACYGNGSYWDGGNCEWWLRSPGFCQSSAADVFADGGIYAGNDYVRNSVTDFFNAVRPALWVNLNP